MDNQASALDRARSHAPLVGALIAAAVIVSDQLAKYWIMFVIELPRRGRIDLSPVFDLTMVENRGVSFGMFQADGLGRWILAGFSLLVAAMLAYWLRQVHRLMLAIGLGLVIGGAIGNLIDRVSRGYVIDFFDFSGLYFPYVFNIADAAITIGVICLALDFLMNKDEA